MVHPVTTAADQKNASTSSSGSSNAASIDLGRVTTRVNVAADTTADSFFVVEASRNGDYSGEEHEVDNVTLSGGGTDFKSYDIAFRHVRAYANASVNTVEIAGRGA